MVFLILDRTGNPRERSETRKQHTFPRYSSNLILVPLPAGMVVEGSLPVAWVSNPSSTSLVPPLCRGFLAQAGSKWVQDSCSSEGTSAGLLKKVRFLAAHRDYQTTNTIFIPRTRYSLGQRNHYQQHARGSSHLCASDGTNMEHYSEVPRLSESQQASTLSTVR
jgi:hypothetical protein